MLNLDLQIERRSPQYYPIGCNQYQKPEDRGKIRCFYYFPIHHMKILILNNPTKLFHL